MSPIAYSGRPLAIEIPQESLPEPFSWQSFLRSPCPNLSNDQSTNLSEHVIERATGPKLPFSPFPLSPPSHRCPINFTAVNWPVPAVPLSLTTNNDSATDDPSHNQTQTDGAAEKISSSIPPAFQYKPLPLPALEPLPFFCHLSSPKSPCALFSLSSTNFCSSISVPSSASQSSISTSHFSTESAASKQITNQQQLSKKRTFSERNGPLDREVDSAPSENESTDTDTSDDSDYPSSKAKQRKIVSHQHTLLKKENKKKKIWQSKEITQLLTLANDERYKNLDEIEKLQKIKEDHFPTRSVDAVFYCYKKHTKAEDREKNRKIWTSAEKETLCSLANKYQNRSGIITKKAWSEMQKNHFPDRSVQSLKVYYSHEMREETGKGKLWSEEESAKLFQIEKEERYQNLPMKEKWQKIQKDHFPTRTPDVLRNYYDKTKEEEERTHKPWTKDEIKTLQDFVAEGKPYTDIFAFFPGRTQVAVMLRYNNLVKSIPPKKQKTDEEEKKEAPKIEWSETDIEKLLVTVEKHKDSPLPHKKKWNTIGKEIGRTSDEAFQQYKKITSKK